jgi:membrane-associated phospholipid phosphatase
MKEIILFIEDYGPIAIAVAICTLIGFTPYLVTFILGGIFTIQLNRIIKPILKCPRPIIPTEYKNDKIEEYGMPSGHAQTIGFSLGFIYFMKISPYLLIFFNFIGVFTMYFRYKSRKHSIAQLFAGYILGIITGLFFYYITKMYLASK